MMEVSNGCRGKGRRWKKTRLPNRYSFNLVYFTKPLNINKNFILPNIFCCRVKFAYNGGYKFLFVWKEIVPGEGYVVRLFDKFDSCERETERRDGVRHVRRLLHVVRLHLVQWHHPFLFSDACLSVLSMWHRRDASWCPD